MHYGLYYLHYPRTDRYSPPRRRPMRPRRGRGPAARSVAALAALMACLGGATYAVADSSDAEPSGRATISGPDSGSGDVSPRPGRLGPAHQ